MMFKTDCCEIYPRSTKSFSRISGDIEIDDVTSGIKSTTTQESKV